MKTAKWEKDPHNPNKVLPLVVLLWEKFHVQPLQFKIITLVVIVITIASLLIFYTSFVLWQLFCFVMSKTVLAGVEWYLRRS